MKKLDKRFNLIIALAIVGPLLFLGGCLPGWNLPEPEPAPEPVEESVEEAIPEEKVEEAQPAQRLNPPAWILGDWTAGADQGLTFDFSATTVEIDTLGTRIDLVQAYQDATATFTERFAENYYAIIVQFPNETNDIVLEFDKLSETTMQYTDRSAYYGFQFPTLELQRVQQIAAEPIEEPIESSCLPWQVNINTAAKEELIQIIHIDDVRSDLIIELRPFQSVEDLTRINGIAELRLRDIIAQGRACV